MNKLKVKLFNQELENPLIIASGVFGYGTEYSFIDYNNFAAYCTKGISLKPRSGNDIPRIIETDNGMLNSIGLQNIGLEEFIDKKLNTIIKLNKKIIVNFFGNTFEEYYELADKLSQYKDFFALEINISCPNIKDTCMNFGQNPKATFELISKVKKIINNTYLIVKLTPNVTSISEIAKAASDAGADALSLINTVKAMKIDINTKKPALNNIFGGLSGPAIKPIAVRCVYEVKKAVSIPIIGMGGITNAKDVVEFMLSGATAVQIGSTLFNDPNICKKIISDLLVYCDENNIKNIGELIGAAH